ncbi:MAG: ATP-grasp domain-containing protein [Bradyrhizobiaceae bacterium]|nr:ATP-grasp domain-containing protein [Bradyrhizobiaceae bacterium]
MHLVIVDPQVSFYRYLIVSKRLGYRTLVLTRDPTACRLGEAEYNRELEASNASAIDELVQCDTGSASSIIAALEPFHGEIAGLIPGDDPYVPVTFEAGRRLGFDYSPPEDAICQQLKTSMKRRLADRQVHTPRFLVAGTFDEAERAWEGFGRDCMVKMVDFAASVNVFRVTTRCQLAEAWKAIQSNPCAVVVPYPLSRDAILEEFVGGLELSAEGYAQDERIVILNFCEKITEKNFVVTGHLLPALLTPEQMRSAETAVQECVRAVGIRNSLFHVEIHMRSNVPYVIECAARPPGLHVVDLISRCYGHDLTEISIALAVGTTVKAERREPRAHYGMFALYARTSGALERVEGLEELHSRGGVVRWHLDLQPGDQVQALESFRQRYGFVILEDKTAEGVRSRAKWFRENVRLAVGARDSAVENPRLLLEAN